MSETDDDDAVVEAGHMRHTLTCPGQKVKPRYTFGVKGQHETLLNFRGQGSRPFATALVWVKHLERVQSCSFRDCNRV